MKHVICAKHKVEKINGVCPVDKRCTRFIVVSEDEYKMYNKRLK